MVLKIESSSFRVVAVLWVGAARRNRTEGLMKVQLEMVLQRWELLFNLLVVGQTQQCWPGVTALSWRSTLLSRAIYIDVDSVLLLPFLLSRSNSLPIAPPWCVYRRQAYQRNNRTAPTRLLKRDSVRFTRRVSVDQCSLALTRIVFIASTCYSKKITYHVVFFYVEQSLELSRVITVWLKEEHLDTPWRQPNKC